MTVCAAIVSVTVGGGPAAAGALPQLGLPDGAGAEVGAGPALARAGEAGVAAGDRATNSGELELDASEFAPEPTTTPNASVAITAIAAARGDSDARNAAAPANGSDLPAPPGSSRPRSPAVRGRLSARDRDASAVIAPATAGGTCPRRAPHDTQ